MQVAVILLYKMVGIVFIACWESQEHIYVIHETYGRKGVLDI